MVLESTLAPGEDYATVSQLLAADDRPEITVRIWNLPIRVRGLGLERREEIRATCWRADGQRDTAALVRAYIEHGVTAPQMNAEQVREFIRKHAGDVESVYLFIDRLTELNYERILATARQIGGLAPGGEPDTPNTETPGDAGTARTGDG